MKKETVHGYWVKFPQELYDAIRYLRQDLQYQEAKTLFESARSRGEAQFEDDMDRDYTLIYNRGEATFTLMRRQRE